MLLCPHCQGILTETQETAGTFWKCHGCGGRLVSVALLRRCADQEHVDLVWALGREGQGPQKQQCPKCSSPMFEVPSTPDPSSPKLHVCRNCTLVWFDYLFIDPAFLPPLSLEEKMKVREVNASIKAFGVPQATKREVKYRNPEMEARERMALALIQKYKKDHSKYPDEWWKILIACLGIPVEISDREIVRLPIMTWLVALIVSIVSISSFSNLEAISQQFGLIPSQLFRYGGLTLFSNFFIHGGWLHLLGNMYFLVVFGASVEDRLGKARFLLILFLSTLAANLLHTAVDPGSDIPCIGASGGVSGIIAFYMLRFPKVRLAFVFWFLIKPIWIRLPAYGYFILWILMQFWGAWMQIRGLSNVSAFAHLGGVAVGIAFWLEWRKKDFDQRCVFKKIE